MSVVAAAAQPLIARVGERYLQSLWLTIPTGAIYGAAQGINSSRDDHRRYPHTYRNGGYRFMSTFVDAAVGTTMGAALGMFYPIAVPALAAAWATRAEQQRAWSWRKDGK